MTGTGRYPHPEVKALKEHYVGKSLKHADTPCAVLDVNVAKRHCKLMLDTCDALDVRFRAHIKTHKSVELTRLQVGDGLRPVNLVVSTMAELEFILPYLQECRSENRHVNVIYGLPVSPSVMKRLAEISAILGEGSISVLLDNPATLEHLHNAFKQSKQVVGAYIKTDAGYGRAGIEPTSSQFTDLLSAFETCHAKNVRAVRLEGFYCHMGSSYGSKSPSDALDWFVQELERSELAAKAAYDRFPKSRLTIAVGATPTAMAAHNLLSGEAPTPAVTRAKECIKRIKQTCDVEIHAGAYSVLDLQQMATHSRGNPNYDDIALTLLAEVASTYPHREVPEVLIACGVLCLGRESCPSYSGMGIITPWDCKDARTRWPSYDPEGSRQGWIVNRVSQEHGLLRWEGDVGEMRELAIGDRVRLWPNHCCIAAAGFSYLLVVDSSKEGKEADCIIDVWVRCRGW